MKLIKIYLDLHSVYASHIKEGFFFRSFCTALEEKCTFKFLYLPLARTTASNVSFKLTISHYLVV